MSANHANVNAETHNPFEGQNVASKRNDAIDGGVGFVVSFGFFAIMFIIATLIDFLAS